MKFTYLILLIHLVIGCKTQSKLTPNEQSMIQNINCPDGGDCVFEVLKDSNLQIKTDEFGELYPEIISGDKLVIKYQFKKDEIENTADSSYSEFIYFEIDKLDKELILKDIDLQKVKMLFGRICFCRGAMGYFRVTEGDLFLSNYDNKLQVNLKFSVQKIPQIVTEINESIKY